MNFFEAQDSARRSTGLLVLLFLLAIAGLLVLSNYLVFAFLYFVEFADLAFSPAQLLQVYDVNLSIMLSAAIIGFITLGSVYKLIALSSGGAAIAQSLGGVIVPRSSTDPLHKKILNVVEEMAIASGTPVPQVYILNEPGINAFAAGWKTTNAVIGITRGALERLNREELQGVIAHEFSHIFNGDMRLNIRLIAILHGILMIGTLGRMVLRSMRYSRSSRNSRSSGQGVLIILTLGAALLIVGYSGLFFGNWIKSLISRQREYLADASAVQFTRSSEGIANALKKIGGTTQGSALLTAAVDEYSHAYFAAGDAVPRLFSFSTHPPLKDRIYRIQPFWDGKYIVEQPSLTPAQVEEGNEEEEKVRRKAVATSLGAGVGASVVLNEAQNAVVNVGELTQDRIDAAHLWHRQLPDLVLENAESPFGAQALVVSLLINDQPDIRQRQYDVISDVYETSFTHHVQQLQAVVTSMAATQASVLIDLVLPTLREMTLGQYQAFESCVQRLIAADKKVNIREWVIQRMLLMHLQQQYGLRKKPIAKYFVLGSAKQACELVLSMLAYLEHPDEKQAVIAFDAARRSISAGALNLLPKKAVSLKNLNRAFDELEYLKPPLKKRLLLACVSCISHDGKVNIPSYDLTRALASCLDVPMPPVMVNRE